MKREWTGDSLDSPYLPQCRQEPHGAINEQTMAVGLLNLQLWTSVYSLQSVWML